MGQVCFAVWIVLLLSPLILLLEELSDLWERGEEKKEEKNPVCFNDKEPFGPTVLVSWSGC